MSIIEMMVLCVFRFCGVAFGLYGWERKGKERKGENRERD